MGYEVGPEADPANHEYAVISDGTPKGTHILRDGEHLKGALSATVDFHVNELATLTITVREPFLELGTISGDRTFWIGLDQVPAEALVQELRSRGELT